MSQVQFHIVRECVYHDRFVLLWIIIFEKKNIESHITKNHILHSYTRIHCNPLPIAKVLLQNLTKNISSNIFSRSGGTDFATITNETPSSCINSDNDNNWDPYITNWIQHMRGRLGIFWSNNLILDDDEMPFWMFLHNWQQITFIFTIADARIYQDKRYF